MRANLRHRRAVEALALRAAAGGVLAILLTGGYWMAGKQKRDSASRVEALRDGRAQQEQALEDPEVLHERNARLYEAGVHEDAAAFGIDPPAFESLLAPNTHAVALQDAHALQAGHSWSSSHLVVHAKHEKVTYQQHGATVSAVHLVAEIENVASVPIAYNVRVRSKDRGRCDVRGVRTHNAVALAPGETASIVVCAGRGALSLEHVEVLELGTLGFHLLSGVPPHALGIDPVSAQAHRPPQSVPDCAGTDVAWLAGEIREGRVRWVDVADFYSRHNCTRWPYVRGYRYASAPLARLPVVEP